MLMMHGISKLCFKLMETGQLFDKCFQVDNAECNKLLRLVEPLSVKLEKSEAIDHIVDCYTNNHKKLKRQTQLHNDINLGKKLFKSSRKSTFPLSEAQNVTRNTDICVSLKLFLRLMKNQHWNPNF